MAKPSAQFVAKMEDVLAVYARPYDAQYPVVCVDEASKELRSTPCGTWPCTPAEPARQDYQYERHGVANIFMAVEPLAGRRAAHVTERRTACDFAEFARFVADEMYPDAHKIVLVTDNLNTHKMASFYERFEPAEARRLVERFEWHYTPEHGSWLNIAEIELSVLHKQCLRRRLTKEELVPAVTAWNCKRNAASCKINWHFTTADSRIKLKRLYPNLSFLTL